MIEVDMGFFRMRFGDILDFHISIGDIGRRVDGRARPLLAKCSNYRIGQVIFSSKKCDVKTNKKGYLICFLFVFYSILAGVLFDNV